MDKIIKLGKKPLYEPKGRLFIIGDVQSEGEKLGSILTQIKDLGLKEEDCIIFCGDLLDAGPDPFKTLWFVRDLIKSHQNTILVYGNHDQMIKHYLNGKNTDVWLANKGMRTIKQFQELEGTSSEELREYFESNGFDKVFDRFQLYWESENVLVTHAPIQRQIARVFGALDPDNNPEGFLESIADDLLWSFENEEGQQIPEWGKVLVCGHQNGGMRAPRFYPPTRIYLDAGCGYKNVPLFCAVLNADGEVETVLESK